MQQKPNKSPVIKANSQPKSLAVKKIWDTFKGDSENQYYGGLTDQAVKAIHVYLIEFVRVHDYKMKVYWDQQPKEIVVHVFDERGKETFLERDIAQPIEKLNKIVGLEDWVIRFADTDYESEED